MGNLFNVKSSWQSMSQQGPQDIGSHKKKPKERMQTKAGIQAHDSVSKKCHGGNKECRGTGKYTVHNLQNLRFDLKGNTNPMEVFQEKLNTTEARGMEDFLGKSTAVFLFAVFNFQAYD